MVPEADTKTESTQTTSTAAPAQPPKPSNPAAVKKAVALGKEIRKQPEKTIDGAGLTPKGAQTYFYNCKRKAKNAG